MHHRDGCPKQLADHRYSRLLDQLMGLMAEGHLKPIGPIKTFSFSEIPSAFRFMRGANHIGKIVISDGPQAKVTVPVSSPMKPRVSSLKDGRRTTYRRAQGSLWYGGDPACPSRRKTSGSAIKKRLQGPEIGSSTAQYRSKRLHSDTRKRRRGQRGRCSAMLQRIAGPCRGSGAGGNGSPSTSIACSGCFTGRIVPMRIDIC